MSVNRDDYRFLGGQRVYEAITRGEVPDVTAALAQVDREVDAIPDSEVDESSD